MRSMVWAVLALMVALPVQAGERIYTPEGWYEVEEGEGEGPDGEILLLIVTDEPAEAGSVVEAAAPPQPPPPAAEPPRQDTILVTDCREVRGRYLGRILELYGVNTFSLQQRDLAAWTYQPPVQGGWGWDAWIVEPALKPLYGLPPVPPGLLSTDFELKVLAQKLLECQQRERPEGSQGATEAPQQSP